VTVQKGTNPLLLNNQEDRQTNPLQHGCFRDQNKGSLKLKQSMVWNTSGAQNAKWARIKNPCGVEEIRPTPLQTVAASRVVLETLHKLQREEMSMDLFVSKILFKPGTARSSSTERQ
jgi:hypothetical protein